MRRTVLHSLASFAHSLQHLDDLDDDDPQEGVERLAGVVVLDDPHDGDDEPPHLDELHEGVDLTAGLRPLKSDQSGTVVCSLDMSLTMISKACDDI